jgi:hypothetical protein
MRLLHRLAIFILFSIISSLSGAGPAQTCSALFNAPARVLLSLATQVFPQWTRDEYFVKRRSLEKALTSIRLDPQNVKAVQEIDSFLYSDSALTGLSDREKQKITETIIRDRSIGGDNTEASIPFIEYLMKLRWTEGLRLRGISPESAPPSFAELAKNVGGVALQHQTGAIIEILKEGYLRPGASNGKGGDKSFIYMEVRHQEKIKHLYSRIVLEVGLNVLDRFHWVKANTNYLYGRSSRHQTYQPNYQAGFAFAEHQPVLSHNEILFDEPIDLSQTDIRIWVPSDTLKSKLISKLHSNGLLSFSGKSFEEIIQVDPKMEIDSQ